MKLQHEASTHQKVKEAFSQADTAAQTSGFLQNCVLGVGPCGNRDDLELYEI